MGLMLPEDMPETVEMPANTWVFLGAGPVSYEPECILEDGSLRFRRAECARR